MALFIGGRTFEKQGLAAMGHSEVIGPYPDSGTMLLDFVASRTVSQISLYSSYITKPWSFIIET